MITEPQARANAAALLRRVPSECERFHPPAGGAGSTTFRLRLGTDRMLLSVKRRPGTPVGVLFHARLRDAGLPVPALIAFDPAAGPGGEACAVWEWLDGVPVEWGPGEPCPYDEAQLGDLLGSIHALPFDGDYGFLGDDLEHREFSLPGLGPTSRDWASFFHCDVAARWYGDRGWLEPAEVELLASLPHRLGKEFALRPRRLLHMGDVMHNGNLLVDPRSRRIRAILDYTESMAGDPRWGLAWMQYYFADYPWERRAFDLARFRVGYAAAHEEDGLARFYLMAILLFEKLRFYDPGSPRGRWALQIVKRLLRSRLCSSPGPQKGRLSTFRAYRVRRRPGMHRKVPLARAPADVRLQGMPGPQFARMKMPAVVSGDEWTAARQQLLVKEKELTRARDALAAERRRMPWMEVAKQYCFEGPEGRVNLVDLFAGRTQLIVYRFFFEPGVVNWPEGGCPGCSFLGDQVSNLAHLNARDTTLVFASRAPQADIERYRRRMGWHMPWYTLTDDFDKDFGVDEWHGTNAFIRDRDRVFRTYFVDARGDEAMGTTWAYLDITALGRQETWEDSPEGYPQSAPYQWWRLHDEYGTAS